MFTENRFQTFLDEQQLLVGMLSHAEKCGADDEIYSPIVSRLARLVDSVSAMTPDTVSEARAQLEIIVVGKRDHGLDFDPEAQTHTLERIVEVLRRSERPAVRSAAGSNRIEPVLEEWHRLE